MDSIAEEIEDRERREKEYAESDAFGIKNLNMYHQVLGIDENLIGTSELGYQTPKEMLRTYKDVIFNDESGIIVENENKSKVIASLDNSINSIGYQYLTLKELDNLKQGDKNSFLVYGKDVIDKENTSHTFGIVTRKDQNGDFILSKIDKESESSQVHTYSIEGNKSKDLAELITKDSFFDGQRSPIEETTFLDELKSMSKNDEAKPYKMAQQKTSNCYIKEVEAGLKYALWSKNPKGEKVKWPITTLQMHEKFTAELVKNLDQAGYSELTEVIKSDFEKYRSEKREIDPKRWKIKKDRIEQESNLGFKNNEAFSVTTFDVLAMDELELKNLKRLKNNDKNFNNELESLKKKGVDLKEVYEDIYNQLNVKKEEYAIVGEKLDKCKKLKFQLNPLKPLKVTLAKRELQKINEELLFLKEQSHKHESFILSEEMDNINKLKEKRPYLFKTKPALSMNEKSLHRLLKDITPNQPSTSRTGTFPIQQKSSLNERRQSAESVASLKNSKLSQSSSQVSIQR